MTDESGRAIALVILGIVAVIAIVGLVLLFTGAKKSATGEFYAPGAKEYGGELRGVFAPLARWDVGGKTYYGSGETGTWSAGLYPESLTDEPIGVVEKNIQQPGIVSYDRDPYRYTPQYQGKSCPEYQSVKANVQEKNDYEAMGRTCSWFEEGGVYCCEASGLETR